MTNAVYLIVAGVLLGPIEGKSEDMAVYTACMEGVDYSDAAMSLSKHRACQAIAAARESPAETCERAMKEIGAQPVRRVSQVDWEKTGRDWDKLRETQPVIGWELDGKEVLCIPAPSGLKR